MFYEFLLITVMLTVLLLNEPVQRDDVDNGSWLLCLLGVDDAADLNVL